MGDHVVARVRCEGVLELHMGNGEALRWEECMGGVHAVCGLCASCLRAMCGLCTTYVSINSLWRFNNQICVNQASLLLVTTLRDASKEFLHQNRREELFPSSKLDFPFKSKLNPCLMMLDHSE